MFEIESIKRARSTGLLASIFFVASASMSHAHLPSPSEELDIIKEELRAPVEIQRKVPSEKKSQSSANYTFYDGTHSGFGTTSNNGEESVFVKMFYTYARDNNTGQNILCSGARIETKGSKKPEDIELRTTSKTLHQLWRPVAGDNENVAEYGSCIKVEAGELDYRNIDFLMDGSGTNGEYIVFRDEPQKELNLFHFQSDLLQEKYPGLLELYDLDPRWEAFVAESDKHVEENSYEAGHNVTECENAGFFYDETLHMQDGTAMDSLPLCERPGAPAP